MQISCILFYLGADVDGRKDWKQKWLENSSSKAKFMDLRFGNGLSAFQPYINRKGFLMPLSAEQLQAEYYSIAPLAERFKLSIKDELEELLHRHKLSLGVPIEHRVKSLESILEKIERKALTISSIKDLPDLIGLRLILLFSRDVTKTCEVISNTFTVLQKEDTQERLDESQFGYQSFHYLIQLPNDWLSVPIIRIRRTIQS